VFQKDVFTGEFVDTWKSTMASVKIAQVSLRRSNVYMYYQLAWAEYDGNTDLHMTLVVLLNQHVILKYTSALLKSLLVLFTVVCCFWVGKPSLGKILGNFF